MIYLADDTVRPGNSFGLMLGIVIASQVLEKNGVNLGITSLNDKKHSRTSLHYADNAVDIRTRDWPEELNPAQITKEIKARLNIHYDVIYEGTHIHLEFQPRGY